MYIRPSHPKSTRDHRNVLFYAASHETFDPDKIVKCVYSSYSETFELRYIIDGRVDWNTAIPFSDVKYASWKAAVAGRRRSASVARPGNVVTRGVMHVRRQSKSQTTEKSGTINVVTFAAANLLCTNQTWGRANEVSDFPREVSDNWGHAILSWAIPSNGQAPGRETPFSGDD